MALDLVVERQKHEPIASVSIEGSVYERLMPLVLAQRPRAFLHLTDYYEDAEIPVQELGDLAAEAGGLVSLSNVPSDVRETARRIQSLARMAMKEGLPVRAYAD